MIAEAVSKAVAAEREESKIYKEAAADLRGRKLEWEKPNMQSEAVLQRGHAVSHYGKALLDAKLLKDKHPRYNFKTEAANSNANRDMDAYIKLYGVRPERTLRYRGCTRLLEVLDMRAGMQEIMKHSYANGTYRSTEFSKDFDIFIAPFICPQGAASVDGCDKASTWLKSEEGSECYSKMKKEFDSRMVKHVDYRKNHRGKCQSAHLCSHI